MARTLSTENRLTRSNGTSVTNMHQREEDKPFESAGHFLRAVMVSNNPTQPEDPRIRALQSEGGFAIPEPILDNLLQDDILQSPLFNHVDQRSVTQGNEYRGVVVDNGSRTDGERNGGLEPELVGEGNTYPYTQSKMRGLSMDLLKHGFIVPATNEVVEDAQSFGQDLTAIAGLEFRHLFENHIWNGTGVGTALGIRNSAALGVVAIEGSQNIANTPVSIAINAAKMMAQIWRLDLSAFYINQELLTSILTATTATFPHAALGPATELAPFGTLFTRPMFPLEVAPAVGTVGDFVLANMSDYLLVQKGGLRTAVSAHVRFLTDESLFRFSVRFNGQPKTSGPITPFTGSLTRHPYVALAARS